MKTQEEIIKMLVDEELDLQAVLDAVIQANGYIGVGLITLAEQVSHKIEHHCGYIYPKEEN